MRLSVLQSGFVSFEGESLIQSEPIPDTQVLRLMGLGKTVDASGNAFFYNRDVQVVFEKLMADHRLMKSFEFREELLKTGIRAFNTLNAYQWFKLQNSSPYLTSIHRKFLNDTLTFIHTGERNISVESWLGLLSPKQATAKDSETPLLIEEMFVPRGTGVSNCLPQKLTRLIAQWTGQDNGFTDFTYFLGIVFSKEVMRTK